MKLKAVITLFAAVAALAFAGFALAATIRGTNGPDTIVGTPAADQIAGLGGHDQIAGGDGRDEIRGGEGNDSLRGNADNDSIAGGEGNDSLWGGQGADNLSGGPGNDELHALADDNQVDQLDCGAGNDIAFINVRERHDQVRNCEKVVYVEVQPGSAESQDG